MDVALSRVSSVLAEQGYSARSSALDYLVVGLTSGIPGYWKGRRVPRPVVVTSSSTREQHCRTPCA
jgi:hypothetical protein